MRALLFVLILAVAALLVALGTGWLDISQTRPAQSPDVRVDRSGVSARGGQTPTFDVETGSVAVGTKRKNVQVPTVQVTPPGGNQQDSNNIVANAG